MTGYMTTPEVAGYLGVSASTLRRWQHDDRLKVGVGKPRHLRIGGRIYYRKEDVKGFLAGMVAEGVSRVVTLK